MAVIRDIVASLYQSGFRKILIVNGHGGNNPVGALAQELMAEYNDISVKFHNWWNAPATWASAKHRPNGFSCQLDGEFSMDKIGTRTGTRG